MALTVRYLNFASFQVMTDRGTNILIDPWLAGAESEEIPASPFKLADLGSVDLVLVSHGGFDHLGDSVEILKKTGALLCAASDVREHAKEEGIPERQMMGMVWGICLKHKDVTIKAVHSQHTSTIRKGGRTLHGPPLGFVVTTSEGQAVYYPGDTAIFSDLKLIGQLYKPDIALLHIGGVFRYGQRMAEMSPLEAAIAASYLEAKVAVPMHYLQRDVEVLREFKTHLHEKSPQTQLKVMKPGDSFKYP